MPAGSNTVPSKHQLGKVAGLSTWLDERSTEAVRVLKFKDLQFEDGRGNNKSILFQAGGVIDFSFCKKEYHGSQFRDEHKLWFIDCISFCFTQPAPPSTSSKNQEVGISCSIDLLKVINSAKLI